MNPKKTKTSKMYDAAFTCLKDINRIFRTRHTRRVQESVKQYFAAPQTHSLKTAK